MKLVSHALCLLLAIVPVAPVLAAEGMWPIDRLEVLPWDEMHHDGIVLDASRTRELARAVVKFPGATGSFVSAEGLILTNHHVAFGCVSSNATLDKNILRDGFVAETRAAELPCKGLALSMLHDTKDVTDRVVLPSDTKIADAYELMRVREQRRDALANECQAGRDDRRCAVVSLHYGARELLLNYDLLRDVRLVHIPENVLADFGGDIDNYEWPRHNADYAFLRAYTAPDGGIKPYDKDNLPYQPLVWLTITLDGYVENDPMIAIGYPGTTSRWTPAALVEQNAVKGLPIGLDRLQRSASILHRAADADPAVALTVANAIQSTENRAKRARGQIAGLSRVEVIKQRRAREKELQAFIDADPQRKKQYGGVLAAIEKLVKLSEHDDPQARVFAGIAGVRPVSWSYSLYEHSVERVLEDGKRRDGFKDRQLSATRLETVDSAQPMVASVDEELLAVNLEDALKLPKDLRIQAVDDAVLRVPGGPKEKARALAKRLIQGTKVGDRDVRAAWWDATREDLLRSGDPLVLFVADLHAQRRPLQDLREKEIDAPLSELLRKYGLALQAWKQDEIAPDANSSLRLSWGLVKGFVPAGGGSRRGFATTMASLLTTVTNLAEYQPSETAMAQLTGTRLPAFVDQQIGDTIVNYIATLDTTGGSSGSPVLDGRGRLVGVAFDGNFEGLAGSYIYDESQVRSLVVDVRYILDLVVRVYGAESLIRELKALD